MATQTHKSILLNIFDFLKRKCHEMNIFSKVLKIETVLFESVLIVFLIFSCLFVQEFQIKVFACFYEIT